MAIATDPNDPNFGLETDTSSPDFGLPVKQEAPEPSGFLKGLETAQKVVGAGQEALMALYRGPGATINRLMFPAQHEWENRPIIPTEVVQPIRKALQYPIQTLNQIVTGEEFKEPLPELGKFASEQISGQTSPENLALLAVAPAIGKLAGGIKLPTTLRETVFGEKPVAPEVTPQISETQITDVVTQPREQGFTATPAESAFNFKEPIQEEVIPSAIKERQIPESNIKEYPGDGEGGPPTETGGGGGIEPIPEIQGRQEVAPAVPSEALAEEGVPQPEQPVVPTTIPSELSSDNPQISRFANRYVQDRVASGEVGEIAPGQGLSTQELVQRGLQMPPERVNEAVSRVVQGGDIPVDDAAAIRGEEARLSQRSASLSKISEADPNNVEAKVAADNAFKDLQDFHNGPVKTLKQNWSNQGKSMQGEIPVDLSTYNGLREAWLRDTGESPPSSMDKTFRDTAQKVSKSIEEQNGAMTRLGDEINKSTTGRKFPTPEQTRDSIMERMKVQPCRT